IAERYDLTQLPSTEGLRLSHTAAELFRVEIVAPSLDLTVTDLEGPHDRKLKCLWRKLEDLPPLGHHDRAIGCDVGDAELDALDGRYARTAPCARTDERRDIFRDGLLAADWLHRHIVIHRVVVKEGNQLGGLDVIGPCRTEPAYNINRVFHLTTPFDPIGTPRDTHPCQPHARLLRFRVKTCDVNPKSKTIQL